MGWETEKCKYPKARDPTLKDVSRDGGWQGGPAGAEGLVLGGDAEGQAGKGQEEPLRGWERQHFLFKSCQYISKVERARPPPLPTHTPSGTQAYLTEGSEANLGNTFGLRYEVNAVINNAFNSKWHPNRVNLGR